MKQRCLAYCLVFFLLTSGLFAEIRVREQSFSDAGMTPGRLWEWLLTADTATGLFARVQDLQSPQPLFAFSGTGEPVKDTAGAWLKADAVVLHARYWDPSGPVIEEEVLARTHPGSGEWRLVGPYHNAALAIAPSWATLSLRRLLADDTPITVQYRLERTATGELLFTGQGATESLSISPDTGALSWNTSNRSLVVDAPLAPYAAPEFALVNFLALKQVGLSEENAALLSLLPLNP